MQNAERGRRGHEQRSFLISAFCILHFAFLILTGCARESAHVEHLRFWGLGREGEVVAQLIPEFERRNPGIHVDLQQIPFTAAHEKLLTAYVGDATPDLAQMGNSWVPEFVAIHGLEPLTDRIARSSVIDRRDYFEGVWTTNVLDGQVYGVPWYVDTRVLFYRTDLLAAAGYPKPPRTWSEWIAGMQAMRARQSHDQFPILLPTNEYPQPVILGLQLGAPLLDAAGRYGAFEEPRFRQSFDFYISIFRKNLAPAIPNSQVANRYQQFATGDFGMMITGPWDVGEFHNRIPASTPWMTAPLPAPDGQPYPGASLAGGASLVLFRASPHKDAAWKLVEFLSEPAQQIRFYDLMRDLPARRSAWKAPAIAADPYMAAFREQLENVVPTPKVAEWEQIATALAEEGDKVVRGSITEPQGLAELDARASRMLAKRRWILDRGTKP